ncbi:MAG TPA: hypothetical protein DCM05_02545, partial [Elusimicrobia bacterium]|nr:hypothetical protein [Elusimicrobiota bacterium]
LKDYPTLNHCVRFVLESKGGAPAAAPAPVQAAAAPKPVAAQVTAPASSLREETVRTEIIALVSEKTGYPAEMLDPALDMEADLGIDTVKQAEIFGLIREKYSIPRKENLSLKDYPTLSHCVRFVLESTGGTATAVPAAPTSAAGTARAEEQQRAAAPQAAAAPTPVPAGTDDAIRADVVALVSEKTGYPAEMLELDLDMEADLGIDTVKQAEIFGLIREKYSIPRAEGLSLKDYPTLRHVIGFVQKSTGQAPAAPAAASSAPAPRPAAAPLTHNLRASVAVPAEEDKRAAAAKAEESSRFNPWRVEVYLKPAKSFIPPMAKDRPAVVLVAETKTAEPFVAAIEKAGGTAVVVKTDYASPAEAAEELKKVLKDRKAGGLLNLTALDLPPSFDDMTPNAFDKGYKRTARALFLAAQVLQPDLAEGWVVTLTRMGGTHGCRAKGPFQPLSGALTGLTKALARELPQASVRAVDFDAETAPSQMAELSLGELGSDDPRLEVGFVRGVRHALRLLRHPRPEILPRRVSQKSVFLITGGGGALATELAKDIAGRFKCRLVLLDLLPLPKEASAWARMSDAELKAFKDSMWEELKKDASRKATPVMLEKEFGRVRFAIKVHRNIEELIRLGAKVLYLSGDLNDPAEVAKAAKAAMKEFGQIDYVIHTAGLEESKLLADKKVEQYDRVIRPKAHGAFHLLKAVPVTGAQRWAFFSSVVARFGNIGQADYATANDFLVKLAAHMSAQKRSAVAFDLTAFANVGMAMKGGVTQFLESMGVDFMPPKIGLGMLLDELVYGGGETEVVLTGALGKFDPEGLMAQQAPAQPGGRQLHDEVLTAEPGRFVLEKTFSLESDPWLHDHSIEGVPYIAGVMGLELFAEASAKLLGAPPKAFSQVRYALPIKLLRGRPASVRVRAEKDGKGGELAIETEFVNAQGIKLGGTRTHFTARIHDGGGDPWEGLQKPALPQAGQKFVAGQDAIYTLNFHGPSFQVLAGMYVLNTQELLALYRRPAKALWPRNARTLVWEPLIVEAAFQTCGFRDLHFTKKLTLPDLAGVIERYDHGPAPDELFVYAVYRGPAQMNDGTDRRIYDAVVFDSSYRAWLRLREFRLIAQ